MWGATRDRWSPALFHETFAELRRDAPPTFPTGRRARTAARSPTRPTRHDLVLRRRRLSASARRRTTVGRPLRVRVPRVREHLRHVDDGAHARRRRPEGPQPELEGADPTRSRRRLGLRRHPRSLRRTALRRRPGHASLFGSRSLPRARPRHHGRGHGADLRRMAARSLALRRRPHLVPARFMGGRRLGRHRRRRRTKGRVPLPRTRPRPGRPPRQRRRRERPRHSRRQTTAQRRSRASSRSPSSAATPSSAAERGRSSAPRAARPRCRSCRCSTASSTRTTPTGSARPSAIP